MLCESEFDKVEELERVPLCCWNDEGVLDDCGGVREWMEVVGLEELWWRTLGTAWMEEGLGVGSGSRDVEVLYGQ